MRDSLGGKNAARGGSGSGSSPGPSIGRYKKLTLMCKLQFLDHRIKELDDQIEHENLFVQVGAFGKACEKNRARRRVLDQERKAVRLERKRYPR